MERIFLVPLRVDGRIVLKFIKVIMEKVSTGKTASLNIVPEAAGRITLRWTVGRHLEGCN
jgi:hypothetical protein